MSPVRVCRSRRSTSTKRGTVAAAMANADSFATNGVFDKPDAAQTAWLDASFNAVDRLNGDFDIYVRGGMGVDRATIDAPAELKRELIA